MHPLFSQGRYLLAGAALWLVLSGLASHLLYRMQEIGLHVAIALYFPLLFLFFFFCLANYYVCLEFPIRRTPFLRLIATQVVANGATVALWLLAGYLHVWFLNRIYPDHWFKLYQDSLASLGGIGALLYCFWILAHYIFLMARQHEAIEREALQKRLLISETELQAVKTAVHPHFLYNSLNTVANLALVEPGKIHNLCLQISDFLRYSVSYGRKTMATVGDELAHIQNYLGIERERFGKRLQVQFEIDETARQEPLPPLLLFPLVENSIKHGIDSLLEGGTVTIRIHYAGDDLCIDVDNPYDELGMKQNGAGIGLEAVIKRVQAQYGRQGQVTSERGNGRFRIELRLPRQRALPAP
jgi:sensor histidine kinase YesM